MLKFGMILLGSFCVSMSFSAEVLLYSTSAKFTNFNMSSRCKFGSLKVDQGSSHQNARLYLLYKLLRILVCMTKSQPFKVA
jgi:hypothetical protein